MDRDLEVLRSNVTDLQRRVLELENAARDKPGSIGHLTFNLPEASSEFQTAVKASSILVAFQDVWTRCFRPAWKHGYSDDSLQKLLESLGDEGYDLLDRIGKIYQEVNVEYGIDQLD